MFTIDEMILRLSKIRYDYGGDLVVVDEHNHPVDSLEYSDEGQSAVLIGFDLYTVLS